MRLTTVNSNAYVRNLSQSKKSVSSSMVDVYHARIEETIKSDPKTCFGYEDLKKKRVTHHHQLCILKVVWPLAPRKSVTSLRNSYNKHIPMMSGCLLMLAQSTCRNTHFLARFSSLQIENVLQDLDINRGSGPDGIPPII
jgi:hypothetical protein